MSEVIDVNNSAEASAAAEVPTFNPSDQHSWSPEQREHWNKTGNIPETPKKAQESATATEPESEGKPKTAAESETAQKQEPKERKPGEKISAQERISQQTARIKELEASLAEAKKSVTKPTPSDDKAKVEEAPKAAKRPNPFTWAGTPEEFEAAQDAYEGRLQEIAAANALQQHSQRQQAQELQGKLDEARKRYADADTRILPVADRIENDQQIPLAVRQIIGESDVLPDLLYTLGADGKLDEFIQMAHTNPGKAIRMVAKLESLINEELSGKAKSEAASEEKPPVEPKPRAPKPPSEVGGRAAASEDGLVTAARANSFRDFEKEMNARLMSRK